MTSLKIDTTFDIEYREKTYTCDVIKISTSTLYRVNFPQSPLHLTKAKARNGDSYWTSIPLDEKVKHVVQELGTIITKHLNG